MSEIRDFGAESEYADSVPENVGGYKLPENWFAEEVAEEIAARVTEILTGDRSEFLEVCHACGLTDRQTGTLYDKVGGVLARSIMREEEENDPRETAAALWPKDTEKHIGILQRGARAAGVADELRSSGVAAHPVVMKLLHFAGRAASEDSMRGATRTGEALPVGENARREMYRLIRSEAYKRADPALMRKLEQLAGRTALR